MYNILMIPQCSPFLRCHGVLAKKKSMKHLDALLLPTRPFSLVLLATSLSSMTQKRHIKMQMAGRQRECNDFQWGSKAIVRGNLVGTACSRCDAKAVGVDAPTSEHFLTTTSHKPPPSGKRIYTFRPAEGSILRRNHSRQNRRRSAPLSK